MSDEQNIVPGEPNLLAAAKDALQSLWDIRHGGANAEAAAKKLQVAIAAYENPKSDSAVTLPLGPVDQTINYNLRAQSHLVKFRAWVETVRTLLDSHLTKRYVSLSIYRYSDDNGHLHIYGAERALELAKALGGRWTKVRGSKGEYMDYECASLPGLGIKVTIDEAEPCTPPEKTALELEVLA